MEEYNIVAKRHCGSLLINPAKELQIEGKVACHLWKPSRGFGDRLLKEDMVENMDETHSVFNMDDGIALSVIGSGDVKYAYMSCGHVGMTIVVLNTGGRDAAIKPPFMVFQNKSRIYPIGSVPDDVPGGSYGNEPNC